VPLLRSGIEDRTVDLPIVGRSSGSFGRGSHCDRSRLRSRFAACVAGGRGHVGRTLRSGLCIGRRGACAAGAVRGLGLQAEPFKRCGGIARGAIASRATRPSFRGRARPTRGLGFQAEPFKRCGGIARGAIASRATRPSFRGPAPHARARLASRAPKAMRRDSPTYRRPRFCGALRAHRKTLRIPHGQSAGTVLLSLTNEKGPAGAFFICGGEGVLPIGDAPDARRGSLTCAPDRFSL
jgi:hypothetical protein